MKRFLWAWSLVGIIALVGCGDGAKEVLESCESNSSCQSIPLQDTNEQTEITEEELRNSIEETGDGNIESNGDDKTLLYFLKKTGQILSYDEDGKEITDGSLKDDGFYQAGLDVKYTRDDAKEIVTDHVTALMWQDDVSSVTKPWLTQENYDACTNGNETACFDTSGDTATTYCNELTLGGYSDWRLPTRAELQGIADYGHNDPAINPVFVNTNSYLYWSSTTAANYNDYAWIVDFYNGYQNNYTAKDPSCYVRCVRAGQ